MAEAGATSDRPAIPSDLLGDDPQPSGPAEWDAVVLRAATAYPLYINRATLRFAAAVASSGNRTDVGRRYVQSYLRRLNTGGSGDPSEFTLWRGLVCELVWTSRGVEAVREFQAAVRNLSCDDWSVIPVGIRERVASAVEASSDRRDWRTFSPNLCSVKWDDDHEALRIQRRLCGLFPARLSCASEPDSPPWCATCEINCSVRFSIVGVALTLTVILIIVECYHRYRAWKNVHRFPIHG